MAMEQSDILILSHLRKDARQNLTRISKHTGIPVSTIFDRMRKYSGSLIRKHTALVDFSELGYDMRANIVLRVHKQDRQQLQNFLEKKGQVNSLYRINNGYDFMVDALFRNMKEVDDFMEELERFRIRAKECYYVLEDIKREEFLSEPLTAGISPGKKGNRGESGWGWQRR